MKDLRGYLSLLVIVLVVFDVFGQSKDIYVFKNRYSQDINQWMESSEVGFKNYEMISRRHIDPKRNNKTDYNSVKKYLQKHFPEKEAEGTLVIDLENKFFKGLKENKKSSKNFEKSKNEFINLIEFIRDERPCLIIGVYGMPFRIHKKSQKVRNENKKLDPILELTDILFPSIYVFNPAKQKGTDYNLNYFEINLNTALEYGERLGKPVVPFVWYLVHESNKKYGLEAIEKDEMAEYLQFILNYEAHGEVVAGIAWWEGNTPYNKQQVKTNIINDKKNKKEVKLNKKANKSEIKQQKFNQQSEAFNYYKTIFHKNSK